MSDLTSDRELTELLTSSPFHELLGLRLAGSDSNRQTLSIEMPLSEAVSRSKGSGQFHGGAIASLIDVAGDFALIWQLGFGVPTINFRTDYLRPAFGKCLTARAHVRRAGRTVGVVDIDVLDQEDRIVAIGRGCYGTRKG